MSKGKTIEVILEGDYLQPIYDLLAENPQQAKKLFEQKTLLILFGKFDYVSIIRLIDHCVAQQLVSVDAFPMTLLLTAVKSPHCEELTTQIKKKIIEDWWPRFTYKSFNSFIDNLMDAFNKGQNKQITHSRIWFLKHIISYLDENYIYETGELLKSLIQDLPNDNQVFFDTLENLLISVLVKFTQDDSLQSYAKNETKKSKENLLNTLFFELLKTFDLENSIPSDFFSFSNYEERYFVIIAEALKSLEPPNDYDKTTLHELCQKSCSLKLLTPVFQLLKNHHIKECTSTKISKIEYGLPLHYAALHSTFEVFEFIATRSTELHIRVKNDETALMMAIRGNVDAEQKVRYLLSCGRNIGLETQKYFTGINCLHDAVIGGRSTIVRLLMDTENARQKLIKQDWRYIKKNQVELKKYPLDYALEFLYQKVPQKTEYREIILTLVGINPPPDLLMQIYNAGINAFQNIDSQKKQAIEEELLFFADEFPALDVFEIALRLGSLKLLQRIPRPYPVDILVNLLNVNTNGYVRRTPMDVTTCFIYLANAQPDLIRACMNETSLLTLACYRDYYDIAAYLFYHPQYILKISDCDLISGFDIENGSMHLLTAIIDKLSLQFKSLTSKNKKLPARSLTVHYDATNINAKRRMTANDSVHHEMREYVNNFSAQNTFKRKERNLAVVCLTFFGRTDHIEEALSDGKQKFKRDIFSIRLAIDDENHINSQGEERSRFRHMIIAGYSTEQILQTKRDKDIDEAGFFLQHWHSERSLLSKLIRPEQIQNIVKSLLEQHFRKIYAIVVNIYTENYPCEACVEAADITHSNTDKNVTFVDLLNQQIDSYNQTVDGDSKLVFKAKAKTNVLTLFSASTPWPKGTKRLERDEHPEMGIIDIKSFQGNRVLFRDSVSIPPTKSDIIVLSKYTVASSGCDKTEERNLKRAKTVADEPNSALSNN